MFYRVKSTSTNGSIQYSRIVKVNMGRTRPSLSIYPNPVSDGVVNIAFVNMPAGLYQVKLYNASGQIVEAKQITHAEGSSSEMITFKKKLSKGVYQLKAATAEGYKETFRLVVE